MRVAGASLVQRWDASAVVARATGRAGESILERIESFIGEMAWRMQSGRDEEGQTMVEYGLIIALVSIVAIATLGLVGTNIKDVFNSIAGKLHS